MYVCVLVDVCVMCDVCAGGAQTLIKQEGRKQKIESISDVSHITRGN